MANGFNPDTGSTLTTNLKAYWKMDEASGTRVDSVNAHDLSDTNTVTQATGIVSSAGQFTSANSEYLSVADHADISAGDTDWSCAFWVYLDSKSASMSFVGKWNSVAADREWICQYDSSDDRFHAIYRASATQKDVVANKIGSPSTATWYFIVVWHDATNDQVGIQGNNLTANTSSWNDGVQDGTGPFYVGTTFGTSAYMNGRIDEIGFWRKVLTSTEKTDLYNSGAGNTYGPLAVASHNLLLLGAGT